MLVLRPPSVPAALRALPAVWTAMKLFNKRAELRICIPRLLDCSGLHQLLCVLIHFGSTIRADHFPGLCHSITPDLLRRDILAAISQCGRHPNQLIQEIARTSHERGVEQFAGFVKELEDISEIDVGEDSD